MMKLLCPRLCLFLIYNPGERGAGGEQGCAEEQGGGRGSSSTWLGVLLMEGGNQNKFCVLNNLIWFHDRFLEHQGSLRVGSPTLTSPPLREVRGARGVRGARRARGVRGVS